MQRVLCRYPLHHSAIYLSSLDAFSFPDTLSTPYIHRLFLMSLHTYAGTPLDWLLLTQLKPHCLPQLPHKPQKRSFLRPPSSNNPTSPCSLWAHNPRWDSSTQATDTGLKDLTPCAPGALREEPRKAKAPSSPPVKTARGQSLSC